MKGYRTPSWFRMKGFLRKKKEKPQKNKDRTIKIKDSAKR
jgi:hypothetical protein